MNKIIFPFFIFCVLISAYEIIKSKPLMIDEVQHYTSIAEISRGEITDKIFLRDAKFPGYVLLMGAISSIIQNNSLPALRLINTIISLVSLYVFYLLAKKVDQKNAKIKTLQFLFLPILFVFFFLIYTDVLSILTLLVALYLLITGHSRLSGLVGILSVLTRQNNILWIGFFLVYLFIEKYQFQVNRRSFVAYLKDTWVYLLSLVVFLVFIINNQGASFGIANKLSQPISFHLGNIYFVLFIYFFLFFPSILSQLSQILDLIKKKKTIIAFLIFFLFYLYSFKVDHFWNSLAFDMFLRNVWLNYFASSLFNKTLFFIPIALTVASLYLAPLKQKSYYLLYPFSFVFLSLSWLIEPRYYLIPFAFFLLFKKTESLIIESLTIIIYLVLSIIIFYGSINNLFFL